MIRACERKQNMSGAEKGAEWVENCVRGQVRSGERESKQESSAIAKMTARCVQYMSALKISGSPQLRPQLLFFTQKLPKRRSYDHAVFTGDSPMTLVSSRLTSARNSKGNIGSEGA